MSIFLGKHEDCVVLDNAAPSMIKEVRAYVVGSRELEEKSGGAADCHSQDDNHWIIGAKPNMNIANPMSIYNKYHESRKSWGIDALGSVVVEIELNSGVVGVGVSIGGEPACFIIEMHLATFIEKQCINNIELIWDQMWRSTINYGRKGLTIQAISAVDLALWDALGHYRNEPVYNLLGGKTKERLPVYATTASPINAKNMGFHGSKFPLPYGVGDGDEGMRKNIEFIAKMRESVGPDFPLMIDCYMSLNENYTIELAERIKPYNIKWIEECLPPDNYDGYKHLKQRISSCLITCGEHEYTRYGFRQLLEGCCDVMQPDVTWCGGITECRRIVALAATYDIPIIPHGSSVYSYHMQIAFVNCPIAEYIIMSPQADKIVPYFGNLFKDEPLPQNGYIELDPKKSGFGVKLNREALDLRRPYRNTRTTTSS